MGSHSRASERVGAALGQCWEASDLPHRQLLPTQSSWLGEGPQQGEEGRGAGVTPGAEGRVAILKHLGGAKLAGVDMQSRRIWVPGLAHSRNPVLLRCPPSFAFSAEWRSLGFSSQSPSSVCKGESTRCGELREPQTLTHLASNHLAPKRHALILL